MIRTRRVAYFDGTSATAARVTLENLDKPSKDNLAMRPYWEMVETELAGVEAMRLAKEKYLPKFPGESADQYTFRLASTKYTNVFGDIVESLSSRPFEAPVTIDENEGESAPDQIKEFVENVDGAQNTITEFAAQTFYQGIADALDWIFVDYPDAEPLPPGVSRSVQQERDAGLRPFWSHVRAINVLEAKSEIRSGNEMLTYVRLYEPSEAENDVRIMEVTPEGRAVWSLWRQRKGALPASKANGTTIWDFVKDGEFSIGEIPLVPFVVGRRVGRRWYVKPPMKAAAELQIELYQEESDLKHISKMSAFPVYAGNGVKPDIDAATGKPKPLVVGPSAALYAPPDGKGASGSWQLLEPSATSLTFHKEKIKDTIANLRELGRFPLSAQSANVTVITSGMASQKSNSAVQLWAFALRNTLENAMRLTALWFGIRDYDPNVNVFTDFDIDGEGGDAELTALKDARTSGDISGKVYTTELTRRNVLSPDYDYEKDQQQILAEGPSDTGSELDETGRPIRTPKQPATPATPAK